VFRQEAAVVFMLMPGMEMLALEELEPETVGLVEHLGLLQMQPHRPPLGVVAVEARRGAG
jgi:hypothetical protein